ncbi:hypothetical protein FRB99_002529, partial [Tulasnella sp. 403]
VTPVSPFATTTTPSLASSASVILTAPQLTLCYMKLKNTSAGSLFPTPLPLPPADPFFPPDRKFFCYICLKDLASFESLRTHINAQLTLPLQDLSLRNLRVGVSGPGTARKMQKEARNARKTLVQKHVRDKHHPHCKVTDIWFDPTLGTPSPPRPRRTGSSPVTSDHPAPEIVGGRPSDDDLLRKSEDLRRQNMAALLDEHVLWFGGEDALFEAVPAYPEWELRGCKYGRISASSSSPPRSRQCYSSSPVASSSHSVPSPSKPPVRSANVLAASATLPDPPVVPSAGFSSTSVPISSYFTSNLLNLLTPLPEVTDLSQFSNVYSDAGMCNAGLEQSLNTLPSNMAYTYSPTSSPTVDAEYSTLDALGPQPFVTGSEGFTSNSDADSLRYTIQSYWTAEYLGGGSGGAV